MKWRPIKTAPKDAMILLCYESFSDDMARVVSMGRWVQWPHTNAVHAALAKGENPLALDHEGRWEIAYVAIMDHGGRWEGKSFQERGCTVEPTHWMPLPQPSKAP